MDTTLRSDNNPQTLERQQIKSQVRKTALLLGIIYLALGFVWVFFSDALSIALRIQRLHSLVSIAAVLVGAISFYLLSIKLLHAFAPAAQAQETNNDQLATLATAIEQTHDLVVVTDRKGRIEYVNPSFQKVTGYTLSEVVGKHTRIMKSGQHDRAFYEKMWDTILDKRVWHDRVINRRKDGSNYVEEKTISPVLDNKGEISHFISLGRDATQTEQLRQQLHAAQRLEAVARLAGGVAHDFNNLLTVILGRTELLHQSLRGNTTAENGLRLIRETGQRAASLTRQLLNFSRKRSEQLLAADLNKTVADIESMVRPLIGADVQMETLMDREVPPANIDPTELEQILMNLVVNARDAMPYGGTLRIETERVGHDNALPNALQGSGKDFVRLRVRDTGTGMDKQTQAKIFEPFYTTKAPGKGTGLGLSTLREIVAAAKGAVTLQSAPGQGTTFEIFLPAASAKATAEVVAETAARQIAAPVEVVADQETILLVDDEISLRELATEILQAAGYRVLQASDGKSALATCRRLEGRIDLVVSDVVMPDISGPELATQLTRSYPKLRILFVSGSPALAPGSSHEIPDGAEFLPKPFSIEALEQKVRTMLGNEAETPRC